MVCLQRSIAFSFTVRIYNYVINCTCFKFHQYFVKLNLIEKLRIFRHILALKKNK